MLRADSADTTLLHGAPFLDPVPASGGALPNVPNRIQADHTVERAPALTGSSGADSAIPNWRSDDDDAVWEERLRDLSGAYAENTIRAYRTAFRAFVRWCKTNDHSALPAAPETVARFVRAIADQNAAAATIRARLSAIVRVHRMLSMPDQVASEQVRIAMRRMHRIRGQQQRQPHGMRAELREKLSAACGSDLAGIRDRALLALGYDTLCRRSELVSLRVEDIDVLGDGAGCILVRRSKNDPLGVGRVAYLSAPTMRLLRSWLEAGRLTSGPILRSVYRDRVGTEALNSYTITRVVKRLAAAAGFDQIRIERLSGHSFRIGAALDMIESGIALVPVMHAGGWKSAEMVLRYTKQIDVRKSGMAQLYGR